MTRKKLILLSVFYISIGLHCVNAQGELTASGGEATGSGGKVSYSVGQLVCTTDEGSNGSIAPGVQQPYEISEIIRDPNYVLDITLECRVYPNPASDFLTLNIDNLNNKKLSYFLFNSNGTLIENKEINKQLEGMRIENEKLIDFVELYVNSLNDHFYYLQDIVTLLELPNWDGLEQRKDILINKIGNINPEFWKIYKGSKT